MKTDRREAERLIVGLAGAHPSAAEQAWLSEHQPAGVILFSRNINNYNQLCAMCSGLHALVPQLEIVVDHEGGAVSQAASALGRPPAAWSLGVLDDPGLTARVHEETGRRLAAAGIDRVLAPVADVMTEARNPVIGSRAFGADAALVTRHVVAAVTGLLNGGVKVCAKHWPGHGAAAEDTHLAEAVLSDSIDLPFQAAVEAGADAIMAGHLKLAGENTGGSSPPATLDRRALAGLRAIFDAKRGRSPRVYADDMTMGGLGPAMARMGVPVPATDDSGLFDPGSLERSWLAAPLDAGCDRILIRGIPWAAFPVADAIPDHDGDRQRTGIAEPRFFPGPYVEARRSLWRRNVAEFAAPDRELIWLDLAADDRWQVAAGSAGSSETLQRAWRTHFTSVRRITDPGAIPRACSRLLVTTHRPLSGVAQWPWEPRNQGSCLVAGHPSGAASLGEILGSGWSVNSLFDVAPEDVCGPDGEPTKI